MSVCCLRKMDVNLKSLYVSGFIISGEKEGNKLTIQKTHEKKRKLISSIFFSTLIFVLSSVTFISCGVKAVLYGDHPKNTSPGFYRVYMDQYGNYYPSMNLSNTSISAHSSNLEDYFTGSQQSFNKELSRLGLDTNKKIPFKEFQTAVIKNIGDSISVKATANEAESVTFIMVGYNNRYNGRNGSLKKLGVLRDKIELELINSPKKKTFIIELYWDGKAAILGADAVTIFDNSQANSYNVGIQLRLLLNQIMTKDIYLIAHSLGANVVTEALFNQNEKVVPDTNLGENSVHKFIHEKYRLPEYVLDGEKTYHAAIIAPAIPGESTFIDYSKRGKVYDRTKDNYCFFAGINTHDMVLNKFIRLPNFFGNTSFGCRRSQVNKVLQQFRDSYDIEKIKIIDFSKRNGHRHLKHGIKSYMDMKEYSEMLGKLYGL